MKLLNVFSKIFSCILIIGALNAGFLEESDLSGRIVDEHFTPRPQLIALLQLVGMPSCRQTLQEINEWAQANLLRRGTRWDVQSDKFEHLVLQLLPDLTALGLIEEVYASYPSYEGAIVHGGEFSWMRSRLYALIAAWNQGVRFGHVYFLTGEQETLPKEIHDMQAYGVCSFPCNQSEQAYFLWNHIEMPAEMQATVQLHVIEAPKKTNLITGEKYLPNTEDTVRCWLTTSPPFGCYLAASNQPHVGRQGLGIMLWAPEGYSFDTIGKGISESMRMGVVLDELARWIYLLYQQSLRM